MCVGSYMHTHVYIYMYCLDNRLAVEAEPEIDRRPNAVGEELEHVRRPLSVERAVAVLAKPIVEARLSDAQTEKDERRGDRERRPEDFVQHPANLKRQIRKTLVWLVYENTRRRVTIGQNGV